MKKMKLLFVDDEENILKSIRRNLISKMDEWEPFFAESGEKAIVLCQQEDFDLIVTDAKMPGMSGGELLKYLRQQSKTADVPSIMLTGFADESIRKEAIEAGIVEFLNKPIIPDEFILRMRNVMRLKTISDELREANKELYESRLEILARLGKAAEFKDNEGGNHVIRVAHFSAILARGMNLSNDIVELIFRTAPAHDIGKLGISDLVLKKTEKLTPDEYGMLKPLTFEEFEIYRSHTNIGFDLLGNTENVILKTAAIIALTHHERWNGGGYPNNLRKEDIPIEGRIVGFADIFDALSSKRSYKEAYPFEKCIEIINEMSGTNLDPALVKVFNENIEKFAKIAEQYP